MATTTPALNRELIHPGDRVCAAVSGGADSVALLLLLHAANGLPRNALGVGLSAVHVHHGLRGAEADADLEFVQALCLRLEVPLHVHHASVPERVARSREAGEPETVEEAARGLRYECFAALIAQGHADSVLTAHTLDDQAETVMMKLLRGAWTEGLSGIHPVVEVQGTESREQGKGNREQGTWSREQGTGSREQGTGNREQGAGSREQGTGNREQGTGSRGQGSGSREQGTGNREQGRAGGRILRPLLGVRREELEEYLRGRGQMWRTDSTNADEAFTRNRIRHQLLPLLRKYNPSLDQALANLAELAREEEARWQAELGRILPQMLLPGKPVRGGGRAVGTAPGEASVALELDRLRGLDPALRRRVVRAAARRLGVRLSFDETARLLALAGFGADPTVSMRTGAGLQLSGGLRAQRSARELQLFRSGLPRGE